MTQVIDKEDPSSICSGQAIIYYCFDALCGWCYGFSAEMKKLTDVYAHQFAFEVLSGGMVLPQNAQPVSRMAKYIKNTYTEVEALTGAEFGKEYLWHIFNADKSDWVLNSEMPAVALSIFKDHAPNRAVEIATDLQQAHMFEGRDLTDPEAYRHLLPKYAMEWAVFSDKLSSALYLDKAYEEFALVEQLQVKAFPVVLLQLPNGKIYLIAQGYTQFGMMQERIEKLVAQLG